jgi:hypothetical protein
MRAKCEDIVKGMMETEFYVPESDGRKYLARQGH